MAGLLPSSSDTSAAEEAAPRVVGLDGDGADELIDALSSETARDLLVALHDEPAAPSDVAKRADTSLQNAQYHLGKLEDAGLIEGIDTRYSEKGREMCIYAPADRPLVVVAGREEQTTGLKAALARLLGGVGILGLASLAIEQAFGYGVASVPSMDDAAPTAEDAAEEEPAAGDAEDTEDAPEAEDSPTDDAAPEDDADPSTVDDPTVFEPETMWEAIAQADSLIELPPGALFFLGGLAVLCCGFAVWYYAQR